MLGLRKDTFPSSTQLSVFGRAYLVERFTKVASHMEAVEADFVVRALNGLLYCRDKGLPHIHRDRPDLFEPVFVGFQPFLERRLLTVIEDVDDCSHLPVDQHRDVLMPFLE